MKLSIFPCEDTAGASCGKVPRQCLPKTMITNKIKSTIATLPQLRAHSSAFCVNFASIYLKSRIFTKNLKDK